MSLEWPASASRVHVVHGPAPPSKLRGELTVVYVHECHFQHHMISSNSSMKPWLVMDARSKQAYLYVKWNLWQS